MIVLIENPKQDLSERSLWEVVRKSIWVVGRKTDYILPLCLLGLSIPIIALAQWKFDLLASPLRTSKMLLTWSTLGVNFATALLAFLVAAFSVFATISDKELFRQLASYRNDTRSISQFKFIFFSFMYVFAFYLAFLLVSVMITVLCEENSPAWFVARRAYHSRPDWVKFSAVTAACAYLALFLHAILCLRGFIWNIYSALIIAIFFDKPTGKGADTV